MRVASPSAKSISAFRSHQTTLFPGSINGGGAFGLHSNDADSREQAPNDRQESADTGASSNGDKDVVKIGQFFNDLQGVGSHPLDEQRFVC